MPTTIRDAQNSIMKGRSKYRRWAEEFKKDWNKPTVDLEIAKFWKSQPEVIKQWYKEKKPKIYKAMEKKYGGE